MIVAVDSFPVTYPEPNDHDGQRHLLFVRITNDDGTVGWGEAVTMWPEATTATAALVAGLSSQVVNRDPRDHAAIHATLVDHTWWYGNGGIASFAIAAIDIALWDLAGKVLDLNVLDLIGGPTHEKLPILISCHAADEDIDRMAHTIASWVDAYAAAGVKIGFGKRGHARLGVDHDRDVAFVAAVRRELGPTKAIMIDLGANIRWDIATAVSRTLAFERHNIDWIEEPLGADNPPGYQTLRSRTTTRIAYGEREWTPRGIQRILGDAPVDVVGVDPGRCEGITGWLTAAGHVRAGGAEINAHTWSGAVVAAASLALSLASPHCRQFEIKPLPNPMQHELAVDPITPTAGHVSRLTGAGLGVTIDEDTLERYRFRPSSN